ncbi:L,D-transpeptidase [Baaleninema sp.]|uniref:L,D-transpeptidase n=1 Tax=Baaleninema sp. TaxID=3101197 RepID=UPI003D061C12
MVRNDATANTVALLCFSGALVLLALEGAKLFPNRFVKASPEPSKPPLLTAKVSVVTVSTPQTPPSPPTPSPPFQRGVGGMTPNLATIDRSSRLVVDLSDRTVSFYRGNQRIDRYPIAVGKPGWETPTGTFEVTDKIPNPTWEHPITGAIVPPGANNPLGERWIGFWTDGVHEIGFHGTPDESVMGEAVSHGCVRMRNADIRQLFDRIEPGTTVVVEP